jgi:hypothetical protein
MVALIVLSIPDVSLAGIYEVVAPGSGVRGDPGVLFGFRYFRITTQEGADLPRPLPGWRPLFLDGLIRPVVLVRTIVSSTLEERRSVTTADGRTLTLDSANADPSPFGHREGFIVDSVELGLAGRHRASGVYYRVKAELIPREKDGNRSSDYLKDAYVGWDLYDWMDIRVGRMKLAFSQAGQKSTEDRPLIYAPHVDTLVPKRQVGAHVGVGDPWGVARLIGGVYNSTGLAVEQIRDPDQLLLTGRLELRVGNLLRAVRVDALDLELTVGANVAWVRENYDPRTEHRWFGIDGRLHIWLFTVEGEWVVKDFFTAAPGNADRKADRGWAWHVDLTVHALPGVLDLGFRVEEADGDRAVRGFGTGLSIDELARQKKRWITVGATLHVTDQVHLAFNYIHREELEGFRLDNDVFLGLLQVAM